MESRGAGSLDGGLILMLISFDFVGWCADSLQSLKLVLPASQFTIQIDELIARLPHIALQGANHLLDRRGHDVVQTFFAVQSAVGLFIGGIPFALTGSIAGHGSVSTR